MKLSNGRDNGKGLTVYDMQEFDTKKEMGLLVQALGTQYSSLREIAVVFHQDDAMPTEPLYSSNVAEAVELLNRLDLNVVNYISVDGEMKGSRIVASINPAFGKLSIRAPGKELDNLVEQLEASFLKH